MRRARRVLASLIGCAGALAAEPARGASEVGPPGATTAASAQGSALARATALLAAQDAAGGEAAAREALAAAEASDGPDSPAALEALDALVRALRARLTGSEEAIQLAARAVGLRERLSAREDGSLVNALVRWSDLLSNAGDFAGARDVAERALATADRSLDPRDPATLGAVNTLASCLADLGHAAESLPLYERALRAYEANDGAESRSVGDVLNNMGTALSDLGQPAKASAVLARAVAIREKVVGPDSPATATALNNLGGALLEVGDMPGARAALQRARAIREKVLGPDDRRTVTSLVNLSAVAQHEGDFPEAVRLLERALDARVRTLGRNHAETGMALGSLGTAWFGAGDAAKARELQEEAVGVLERALGPDHPLVAQALRNVAESCRALGDHPAARDRAARALAIVEARLGADSLDAARIVTTVALLDESIGRYREALAGFDRALAIETRELSPLAAEVVMQQVNAGWMALSSNDVNQAVQRLDEARRAAVAGPGSSHPYTAIATSRLASARAQAGDLAAALDLAVEAEGTFREQLRLITRGLSERDALRHAANRETGLNVAIALAILDTPPPGAARAALDALVRSRALVLDELAARQGAARLARDPACVERAGAVDEARRRLAAAAVRGRSDRPEAYRAEIGALAAARDLAERDLAATCATFAAERDRERIGLADVVEALGEGSGLLSYHVGWVDDVLDVRRRPEGTVGPPLARRRCVAFVVGPAHGEPEALDLGPAEEIESLVQAWRRLQAGGAPSSSACREAGEALRARTWDPVAPYLAGANRVFVVPDGGLHFVSLPTLPAEFRADAGSAASRAATTYLVETGPTFHVVGSERDLARRPSPRTSGPALLVVGDPAFGPAAPRRPGDRLASHGAGSESLWSGTRDLAPLPQARREAREVDRTWRAAGSGPSWLLVGEAATEEAFARRAAEASVLHVATHAFFLDGATDGGTPRQTRGLVPPVAPADAWAGTVGRENPLLLSGLAFAGASRPETADATGRDGILTAEEVAALDLSGVEWAVLSACGTAMGTVQSCEGVLGLERAFRVAGARTIVMSLWDVDDAATRQWMKELYRARLDRNLDTAECVREASLAVLRDRRAKGLDDSPFWWGAFVASGG